MATDLGVRLLSEEEALEMEPVAPQTPPRPWYKRRAAGAAAVAFSVVLIVVVVALASTNELRPNGSRPAAASTDPALAKMTPPTEHGYVRPGVRRVSHVFSGAAETHNSTIAYDAEVVDHVVVLDNVLEAIAIQCPTLGTEHDVSPSIQPAEISITFSSDSAAASYATAWAPSTNHSMVLVLTANWGCGYNLRRMVAVSPSPSSSRILVLTTIAASIGDIFPNSNISYNVSRTAGELNTSHRGRRASDDASGTHTTTTSFGRKFPLFSRSAGAVSGSITADFQMTFSFDAHMSTGDYVPTSFEAKLSSTASLKLAASLRSSYEFNQDLPDYETDSLSVFSYVVLVGSVPVPVEVLLSAGGGASLSAAGEASLSGSMEISKTITVSAYYTRESGLNASHELAPTQFTRSTPQIDGGVTARVEAFIGPTVFLKLFDLGGPTLSVNLHGDIDASVGHEAHADGCSSSGEISLGSHAWLTSDVAAELEFWGWSYMTVPINVYTSPKKTLFHTCIDQYQY